jgi:hypothetical protein
VPGPGIYNPDYKKLISSNPSFSMTKKFKEIKFDQTPGPLSVNFLIYFSIILKIYIKAFILVFIKQKENLF